MGKIEAGYNGIIDVSVIAVYLFENPLRNEAIEFMEEVLKRENPAGIPVSCFLGAYHITTRYLKCPRDLIAREIKETLKVDSPAFIPDLDIDVVLDGIEAAETYNIESWDGYLVSLARGYKTPVIYSLDKGFKKVPDISLIMPFSERGITEYHTWIKTLKSPES